MIWERMTIAFKGKQSWQGPYYAAGDSKVYRFSQAVEGRSRGMRCQLSDVNRVVRGRAEAACELFILILAFVPSTKCLLEGLKRTLAVQLT